MGLSVANLGGEHHFDSCITDAAFRNVNNIARRYRVQVSTYDFLFYAIEALCLFSNVVCFGKNLFVSSGKKLKGKAEDVTAASVEGVMGVMGIKMVANVSSIQ